MPVPRERNVIFAQRQSSSRAICLFQSGPSSDFIFQKRFCKESARSYAAQASVAETGTDTNQGGILPGVCVCVCPSVGEGLLLRDGDIFWSLNGQRVPTETGSNVRSAMEVTLIRALPSLSPLSLSL